MPLDFSLSEAESRLADTFKEIIGPAVEIGRAHV